MKNMVQISDNLLYYYDFTSRFNIYIKNITMDAERCVDAIDINENMRTAYYFKTIDNIYPRNSGVLVFHWVSRYVLTRKCICEVFQRIIKFDYSYIIRNYIISTDALNMYLNEAAYKRDDDCV